MFIEDSDNHIEFEGYKFYYKENVKEYKVDEKDFNKWDYQLYETAIISNPTIILCAEELPNNAFAHFVYETAIWIPLFKKMRSEGMNILFHVNGSKKFKTLFFEYFGIEELLIDHLPLNNICYFVEPICFNNDKSVVSDKYKTLLNSFIDELKVSKYKKREYLLMPRQTKENYKPNDRTIDTSELEEIFTNEKLQILNTDEVENLEYQINMVSSTEEIFLTEGSPLLVNGLFCRNSTIICIGFLNYFQSKCLPKYEYQLKIIQETLNNKLKYVDYNK